MSATLPPNVLSASASNFFDASCERMQLLAFRWRDEAGYENIADYKANLQVIADQHGVTITKMTRRPFGCEFTVDGRTYHYTCSLTTGNIEYRRIA